MRVLFLFFISMVICSDVVNAQSKARPNILIILSDDQGWGDAGFNGCTDIPTPNLDALAKSGVVFSHAYVPHSYCSPSRAGILTGRNQARFGHEANPENVLADDNSNVGLPLSELMISELLRKNNYQTCAIGKWHLGNAPKFWPTSRGFNDWFGFTGGGMDYWGKTKGSPMLGVLRNGVPVPKEEVTYLTDDFTREAVNYIGGYAKKDKPFFMYLAYNAPHAPIQATQQYVDKVQYIEEGKRAGYAAMVAGMDAGIGKVIQKLKETGQYDNTIIFFLSDNGGHRSGANNAPYRGYKGMLFEGGIRVPFVMSWPKGFKGGSHFDQAVVSLDIYPTILAAAGIKYPGPHKLDGISLLPYVKNTKMAMNRKPMFWRYSDGVGYAVVDGDFKMVHSGFRKETFLFNLKNDPYEHTNLAQGDPVKLKQMEALYANWNAQTVRPLWEDDHVPHVNEDAAERKAFLDGVTRGEKKN